MPVNDTDKLLVNDGSKTETITFAQFKDGTVLNDSDKFLINDGTKTETVTWAEIEDELGPKGVVNQPIVLKPKDGAGSGEEQFLKSDTITDIEGGGVVTCETDTITNVDILQVDYKPARTETTVNSIDWSSIIETQRLNVGQKPSLGGVTNFSVYRFDSPQKFSWGTDAGGGGFNVSYFYSNTGAANSWVFDSSATGVQPDGEVVYSTHLAEYWVAVYVGAAAPITSPDATQTIDHGVDSWSTTANGTPLTLTLAGDKDLDCFEPGDVVQSNWNQTQQWTSQLTAANGFESANSAEKAFNGDINTYARSVDRDTTITFTPTTPIQFNSSVRVYRIYSGNLVLNNGTPVTFGAGTEWTTVATGSGILTSLSGTSNSNNQVVWSAIEVDGKILVTPGIEDPNAVKITSKDENTSTIVVDGGEWSDGTSDPGTDQSQVWSALLTSDTGFISPKTNAFDGDTSTHAASDTAGTLTFTPNLTVPANSTIEMWLGSGSGSNFEMTVTIDGVPSTVDGGSYQSVSYNNSTSINTITISRANSTNSAEIRAMKINGEVLVDAVGDRKLVKETPYDTKLTVAGPTDLADMTGSVWMTDGAGAPGPYTQTPYKLVTSDIESVAPRSSTESLYILDRLPTNLQDVLDNATLWNSGDTLSAGEYIIRVNNEGIKDTGYLFATNPNGDIGLKGGDTSGGSYKADGTLLADKAQSYGPTEWTSLAFSADAPDPNDFSNPGGYYSFYTHPSVAYQVFLMNGTGVNVDGVTTAASLTDIKLTFPGDVSTNPDLRYFKPGDELQGGFTYDMGGGTATATFTSTNGNSIDVIMDGIVDNTNNRVVASASSMPGTVTCVPINPVPGGAKISLVYALGNIPNSFTYSDAITLTEINGNPITPLNFDEVLESTLNTNSALGVWKFPEGLDAASFAFTISNQIDGNNPVIWGFAVEEIPPATVISTGYPDSNTMVVDGGKWDTSNQSEVWSQTRWVNVNNTGWLANRGPDKAFNGVGPGNPADTSVALAGSPIEFLLNGEFVGNWTAYCGGDRKVFVDNREVYDGSSGDITVQTFTTNATNQKIIFKENVNALPTSDGAIAGQLTFNGKLLVDQGITGLGDTHVEYQTNGGQGTIVEVNTDDNTLLIANTGDRDNRWIAENKAATDFYVAGPSIIDEPLLTTNVELESSQFATTPDGVDGLKEIIWNINNVDQSAGTLNPYRPTGLPLNSEITIKVKHVANSIGESAWSASTKFTTGASRSLKDHYVKQIRELEKQLAAAQGTKTRSVETGERKRARNADGTYRGDDPSTPDVNEAWEDG